MTFIGLLVIIERINEQEHCLQLFVVNMQSNCLRKGQGFVNKQQMERTLKDYHWMIREIKRQQDILNEDIGTRVVAVSGLESTLPKAKGIVGNPVVKEVIRREQKSSWLMKLEKKVLFIQERLPAVDEPREKAVLECMLDGMTISAISKHMGLSRKHIYSIRDSIIDKMLQFTQSSQ
jgi:hypothetical protein